MKKNAKIINTLIKMDLEERLPLNNFLYKLIAGRLWKDGLLCAELGCDLKELIYIVSRAKEYSELIRKEDSARNYLGRVEVQKATLKKIEKLFLDVYYNNILLLKKIKMEVKENENI